MTAFRCPFCDAKKTWVRESKGGKPYIRFRKCFTCKKAFKTMESHIQSEVETYINYIAAIASDELVEKVMDVLLNSKQIRTIIAARLKKTAGVQKTLDPLKMFR